MFSRIMLLAVVGLVLLPGSVRAQHSELWGREGERWDAGSRLPDFSFAGYANGERAIPVVSATVDVRDFGADGQDEADDTAAFLMAIEAAQGGAVSIPSGTFFLSDRLVIDKPNVVLRGAGRDSTTLFFERPLEEIDPNMGSTTSGRPTSNYSWSGGLVWFEGDFGEDILGRVFEPARRGDVQLVVGRIADIEVGDWIEVYVEDTQDLSLVEHLYGGHPGETQELVARHNSASQVVRVLDVEGDTLHLNRPLRFDVRDEWEPVVRSFEPTVTECGIEDLTLEMPERPYEGHFTEYGFNGITFRDVAHCWARAVRIHNADSGLFVRGVFNTVQDVLLTSTRPRWEHPEGHHPHGTVGHHGISMTGNDNLLKEFEIRTRFVHDITVSHGAGNVISDGRGEDLSLDHHKRFPYANLFTNLHMGAGTRPWRSGGGRALGRHAAAWNTYWNITADRPLELPPDGYATPLINLVAYDSDAGEETVPQEMWFEPIPTQWILPVNLHEAMLERRLEYQNEAIKR